MGDQENRETLERFWAALASKDFAAAASYIHDDVKEFYPQSGEVIRGKENWLRLVTSFPGFPSIEHRRTIGGGEVWASELEFDYGGEMAGQKWQVAEIVEMRDGKLWRLHEYELKYGPVGSLVDRLMFRRTVGGAADGFLESLARRAEGDSANAE